MIDHLVHHGKTSGSKLITSSQILQHCVWVQLILYCQYVLLDLIGTGFSLPGDQQFSIAILPRVFRALRPSHIALATIALAKRTSFAIVSACVIALGAFSLAPIVPHLLLFDLFALFLLAQADLHVLYLPQLGHVVSLGLLLCLLIELGHHLVIVILLSLLVQGCHWHSLLVQIHELLIALVDNLRGDFGHFWLIHEQPFRVFSLKDGEVLIEEGLEGLEFIFRGDLALAVVGCIDQVIDNLGANIGGRLLLLIQDNLVYILLG